MAEEKFLEGLPMLLNLGAPESVIGFASAYRDTDTRQVRIEIDLIDQRAIEAMDHLDEILELKAIGFAGIMKKPNVMERVAPSATVCKCGHGLSVHIPRADKPFAWPCTQCECGEYREVQHGR